MRLPGRLVFCLCIPARLLARSFAPCLLVCWLFACVLVAHSPMCLFVYLSACLCACYLLGCLCVACLSARSFIRPLVCLFACCLFVVCSLLLFVVCLLLVVCFVRWLFVVRLLPVRYAFACCFYRVCLPVCASIAQIILIHQVVHVSTTRGRRDAFYNARPVSSHGSLDSWPPAQGHPKPSHV